jgi:hypothetical protein
MMVIGMTTDDYRHPSSGRIYRQGDPAHTYILALRAARAAAEWFLRDTNLTADGDYLTAFEQRPDRSTYRLRDNLDFLLHAEQLVRFEKHRREPPDDDWRRKYAPVSS